MIRDTIRDICFLSVLFGIILTLISDRGVKQVTGILCSCVLIICVFRPFAEIDYDSLAVDMALYRERERELVESGEKMSERLNRTVIEKEYAAYITDKGDELGAEVENVSVEVRWDTDGIWVPWETYIEYGGDERLSETLKKVLTAELGIPEERQIWTQ